MSSEQEKDKTPKAPKGPARVTPPVTPAPLVYAGATIQRLGLYHATVYRNGLPARFDEYFVACPQLRALFVEVSKAPVALPSLREKGTAINVISGRVTAFFAKESK